tara:strand:+ start:439 stop:591 length:153 start_codon:yes stop_codon:yes gene_type:complete
MEKWKGLPAGASRTRAELSTDALRPCYKIFCVGKRIKTEMGFSGLIWIFD